MKKAFILILCLITAFSFTSCSKSALNDSAANEIGSSPESFYSYSADSSAGQGYVTEDSAEITDTKADKQNEKIIKTMRKSISVS